MDKPPIAAILFSPVTISPGWNSHPVERPLLCTRRSEEDSEMNYCSRVLLGFRMGHHLRHDTCRRWLTSPRRVFSILPFTSLAKSASSSTSRWAVIIGVLKEEQRIFSTDHLTHFAFAHNQSSHFLRPPGTENTSLSAFAASEAWKKKKKARQEGCPRLYDYYTWCS